MSDPNFLFSLPPFIEQRDGIPTIVVEPSGGDDTPRIQAAVDRLNAVSGGTLRFSGGDFNLAKAFWVGDSIRFGGS